ncbi:hypothetical protein OROGR_026292 [Orobanche gracilis]
MRLGRTVLQPANIGLSSQFQWSQIIKTSSDLLHPVLIETSNLECRSNTRWCGRSYTVSASSANRENKKGRRGISKDVRKSMLENFVNKYREMNAGKFPTTSEAMKDVGGSYYIVRVILQELKHNFKMSSLDITDTSSQRSAPKKKDEISTNIGEVSQAPQWGKLTSPISKADTVDSSNKTFKSDQRPQSSILVEDDGGSKDMCTQSYCPTDEPKSSPHFDPGNNKHETVDQDKQEPDGSLSKAEPHESTEVSERELHKVTTEDSDHKTKSSVWQNLKSFANGILGTWKRS